MGNDIQHESTWRQNVEPEEPELPWKQVKKMFQKLVSRLYGHGYETMIVSVRREHDCCHSLGSQAGENYLGCHGIPADFLAYCKGSHRDNKLERLISDDESTTSDLTPCLEDSTIDEPQAHSECDILLNTKTEPMEYTPLVNSDGSDVGILPANTTNGKNVVSSESCSTPVNSDVSNSHISGDDSVVNTVFNDKHKRFKCDFCNKIYTHYWKKTRHMKESHVYKFPCTETGCGAKFRVQSMLDKHQRVNHRTEPSVPVKFDCSKCSQNYKYRSSLDRHMEYKHCTDRRWQCDKCPATFQGKLGLKDHMSIHKETKDYICEICGKAFRTHVNLHSHKQSHGSVKACKCDVCGHAYNSKANLTAHIIRTKHFSDLQSEASLSYRTCEVCGLKFGDTYKLNRHMTTHNCNVPLFNCTFCEKTFRNKSNLRVHENIHTGSQPSCYICEEMFRSNKKLHEHIEHNHTITECQ